MAEGLLMVPLTAASANLLGPEQQRARLPVPRGDFVDRWWGELERPAPERDGAGLVRLPGLDRIPPQPHPAAAAVLWAKLTDRPASEPLAVWDRDLVSRW